MIRNFTLSALCALSIGLMAGCQDSTVVDTGNGEAFAMYSVDAAALNDFSEIAAADELPAEESALRGERGGGAERGWGRLEIRSYERIIRQLQLSERQTAAVRECFANYRECATSAATRYRNARAEKSEALRNGMERVRAAAINGSMTREEAGAAYARMNREYRQEVATLNEAFKAATDACRDSVESCIEGFLTEDQLVRWNRLNR